MAENPSPPLEVEVEAKPKPTIAAAVSGAIEVKEETPDSSGVPPKRAFEPLPTMPNPRTDYKTSVQVAGSLYVSPRPAPKPKPAAKEGEKGSELTTADQSDKLVEKQVREEIPGTSTPRDETKDAAMKKKQAPDPGPVAGTSTKTEETKAGPLILKDDRKDDLNLPEPTPMALVRPTILVTKGSTEEPVVVLPGNVETPTESSTRIARIQEQLYTDSCGNILPRMPMSNVGRYKARRSVEGTGLFRIDDRAKNQAAVLRKKNQALQEEAENRLGEDLDEDLSLSTLEKVLGELDEKAETKKASPQSSGPVPIDEDNSQSDTKVLPAVTLDPIEAKKKPAPQQGKPMSLATIINLKRMRDRIGGRVVTAKTFAKNLTHEKKLKEHSHNIAVGLPLPLKMAIHEEAMQVVAGTVKAYSKTLGKKHAFTVEAEKFLADMKKKADDYSQI